MKLSDALHKWLQDYPSIFMAEDIPQGVRLREVATTKEVPILFARVSQWRRQANATGEADYINLVFEDERELILSHAGFAFAPSYATVGESVQLPNVVCFQDYARFKHHLDHLYQEETRRGEALQSLMSCLAILEGAALVGLEISGEEKDLEVILKFLDTH